MIIKILGILDILTAVCFWLFGIFHILPDSFILLLGFYLLIKGIIFLISADIASILDIACSIVIFISLTYSIPVVIIFLVALFLLQKGIFSLLS